MAEVLLPPIIVLAIFCHTQAKAALQADYNADTSAHGQLAAAAQQQKDFNRAVQNKWQQAQATQCPIADLQRPKDQGNFELQSLLSLVPELRDMMTRQNAVLQCGWLESP